jgi:hypothetical protein
MLKTEFISISDLSRNPVEVFKKLEDGKCLIVMRNNRPTGYLVDINDPAIQMIQCGKCGRRNDAA